MHISSRGVKFIAGFEGFRSRPYQDTGGVWTIGYGHTSGVTRNSPPISRRAARRLLRADLNHTYVPAVNRMLKEAGIGMAQNRFDATVSAVYNLGPGILEPGRSFGREVRRSHWRAAGDALLLYVNDAAGHRLAGLVRRRKAERALFLERPVRAATHRMIHRLTGGRA